MTSVHVHCPMDSVKITTIIIVVKAPVASLGSFSTYGSTLNLTQLMKRNTFQPISLLITISNLDHDPHLEGHPDVHLRAALRGEDQIVNGEHVSFLFWAKLMFKYLLRC